MRLRTHAGFRVFWTASTVSDFGTPITTLAIQVLVVTTLSGSAADVAVFGRLSLVNDVAHHGVAPL